MGYLRCGIRVVRMVHAGAVRGCGCLRLVDDYWVPSRIRSAVRFAARFGLRLPRLSPGEKPHPSGIDVVADGQGRWLSGLPGQIWQPEPRRAETSTMGRSGKMLGHSG